MTYVIYSENIITTIRHIIIHAHAHTRTRTRTHTQCWQRRVAAAALQFTCSPRRSRRAAVPAADREPLHVSSPSDALVLHAGRVRLLRRYYY